MKKLFGIALIAVVAVAAGWNFSQSQNQVEFSDLTLANVEALAVPAEVGVHFKCENSTIWCYFSNGWKYGKYRPITR